MLEQPVESQAIVEPLSAEEQAVLDQKQAKRRKIELASFAIMIIGGPGSVLGALVVGLVFGFTQAIVSNFASPTVAAFSYLGAMLLILLFKPSGLFAK